MIKLKNNYVIDSDGNSFQLKRVSDRKDKFGENIAVSCGYYADFTDALRGYTSRLLLDEVNNKDMDIKELIDTLKAASQDIRDIKRGLYGK